MVCPIETEKMTALARHLGAGTVSQTLTGAGHQKLATQYLRRELQDADEANLLDEEDMHIFGLRPMTDPLNLVFCNACKKPIKASHYAAHAELCKYLSLQVDVSLELDGTTVNRKPPRKERKKLQTTQTKKASSIKEPKNFKAVDSEDIPASHANVDARIPVIPSVQTKTRKMSVTSRPKINGSRVSPCSIDCSEDVTQRSSKPLKRAATESPSTGNKNMGKTSVEIFPYAPAPLATKIYYSQRNHRLRRAICQMFFAESSKEPRSEVSNLDVLQNAVPTQTSTSSNFCQEVENQQSNGHFLHQVQTQDQMLGASSEVYISTQGRIAPSMNVASQLPMDNTHEPHYPSKSYSFAGKSVNCIGTVQQGGGSVPVV